MKRQGRRAISFLLLCLLGACSQPAPKGERIRVTASIFPLADIVRNIGGERIDVDILIPPGASPHVFEPTPGAYRRFASTQLFVMVGAGMEFWAEKLIEANSGDDVLVVRATDGVRLIQVAGHDRHSSPEQDASLPAAPGHDQESDEYSTGRQGNPHVWLDPVLMRSFARRICRALSQLDPEHAGEYGQRLDRFQQQLELLHHDIQQSVAGFRIREYVTQHPAWSYFSRRYGLKEVGIIQLSPGRDPTPKQIEEIVRAVSEYHIRAIFAEPQYSRAAAEALARETGVRVLLLDPIGGPDLPGRDSYLAMMRYNLEIMREAMQ